MKKLTSLSLLSIILVTSATSAMATLPEKIPGLCPSPASIQALPNQDDPKQHIYTNVGVPSWGAMAFMSAASEKAAQPVSKFVTAIINTGSTSFPYIGKVTPVHCVYQLADNSMMVLHSMSIMHAAGMFDIKPMQATNWQTKTSNILACKANDIAACTWQVNWHQPINT